MPNENITAPNTSDYKLNREFRLFGNKAKRELNGRCFKQDQTTYDHGKTLTIYIVYEISKNINISDYPTLEKPLFGVVSLTKISDIDKYKYCVYGIAFDRHGFFSYPTTGTGRNAIVFGVDMSSSTKIDNRKKYIILLGKGATQGLEHTMSAEKVYWINFTWHNKKFCLSLLYNGANRYLFVNGTEIHKFKAQDSEIVATPLCLGNL